jgi:hypothetical protein
MMAYQPALDTDTPINRRVFAAFTDRDKILASFEKNRKGYLDMMRTYAREIARTNGTGEITVDDVRRRAMESHFPMPKDLGFTEKCFGRLLSGCSDFEPVRVIDSTRAERLARSGRNASAITVYRLKEGC